MKVKKFLKKRYIDLSWKNYFVNAMVTVSAIIFITGARTMVMTAKIKELQHYAEFSEVFVLSLMILVINLLAKFLFQGLANRKKM